MHSDDDPQRLWTIPQLLEQEGEGRLLIGCMDQVHDMSANAEMYGPEGPYNCFVGKDASVPLAKMKFDAELFDLKKHHWTMLDEKELKILQDWAKKFDAKYPVVGRLEARKGE